MADALHRTSTSGNFDTDLIIIGGGPAGCAAARMAASVGMHSVLIEPHGLCDSLVCIPVLDNVLGGYTSGPQLAHSIHADIRSTKLCELKVGHRAVQLDADDDHAAVLLDSGTRLTAPYAVVATGVRPSLPHDVPWITVPSRHPTPLPLWLAGSKESEGCTLLVLGADRTIGTFLRANPGLDAHLLVAYPEDDDYKTEEIRDDPRVTLLPIEHLTLRPETGMAETAELRDRSGEQRMVSVDATFLSIGNTPTYPAGSLIPDATGYCHPGDQPQRLLVAGDLRSARCQRIMTAMGSGSEAALHAYYATR